MFRYAHDIGLYLLISIPLLVFIFIWLKNWRKKAMSAFVESGLQESLAPNMSPLKRGLKASLITLALVSLCIGIADPQVGTKYEEVKREGFDVIIALDVSNSMLAEDLAPSRMARSKQAISKLIDRLKNDRIGIVVFAGEAFVQLPLTTDHSAAKLFLTSIDTDIIPNQGTAIGAAIELAASSFSEAQQKNRAIIVISDGENHEDDAMEQATAAAEAGISVHTIGIGSSDGAPIPVYQRGRKMGYRKDKEGNTVVSKLNEVMLQQVAGAGDGSYIRANNTKVGLNALFSELEKMERTEFGSKMFTSYEDRFQIFLAIALALLFIELLIPSRKSRLVGHIKLFSVKSKK
jgi:Ca-activated chloride channel homolog